MSIGKLSRAARRSIAARVSKWPDELTPIPASEFPDGASAPDAAWRSKDYIVQMKMEASGYRRLTVSRTLVDAGGNYGADISWDELQAIKHSIGFGEKWAVECYPPNSEVVNVANMRHLFILDAPPDYGWKNPPSAAGGDK